MRWLRRLNRRLLLRYRLEYVVGLAVVSVVRALPPAFAWEGARAVGNLVWRSGLRRRAIMTNLGIAFPEKSEAERREIGRRMMEHFASVVVDILFQRRMLSRRNLMRKVRFHGWMERFLAEQPLADLPGQVRRNLFVTAHLGNWEISSGLFGLLGIRIDPVYRTPRNPFIAKLLRRIRLDSEFEFIEKRGAVAAMMETFGKGGNVGFLFDQEAVYGPYIPFFGREACTHKTPAVLARDHSVPVFFGVMIRRGDYLHYEGRGDLVPIPPATDDKDADIRAILGELVARLENEIRRCPEQYLWAHRRWKRAGVHGEKFLPPRKQATEKQT